MLYSIFELTFHFDCAGRYGTARRDKYRKQFEDTPAVGRTPRAAWRRLRGLLDQFAIVGTMERFDESLLDCTSAACGTFAAGAAWSTFGAEKVAMVADRGQITFYSLADVSSAGQSGELAIGDVCVGVLGAGTLVLDEVDLILHPLKSELNWPLGVKARNPSTTFFPRPTPSTAALPPRYTHTP